MDLIINQMVELQVVHDSDCYTVIERLTGTSVTKLDLTVFSHSRFTEACADIFLVCAVKYRSHYLPAELLRSHSEMYFENLTDVHSGRNAQRVKNDVKRCTVGQEGHILLRKDS